MNDLNDILRAAHCAARWHSNQKRKGAAAEPYINHLLEVAAIVADATGGADADMVIAALLHDTIEDCEVPVPLLERKFGARVAGLVKEMTDDKSLDKAVRKQKQIESAPHKSPDAKILKLADKISNVRAVATSPCPDWSVARRLDYVAWAEAVVKALDAAHPDLEREFAVAAHNARQAITVDDGEA